MENRISCFKDGNGVYKARIWESGAHLSAMLAAGVGRTRAEAIKEAKAHLARGGFKAERPPEAPEAPGVTGLRILASRLALALGSMETREAWMESQLADLRRRRSVDTYEHVARHAHEAGAAFALATGMLVGLEAMVEALDATHEDVEAVRKRAADLGVRT